MLDRESMVRAWPLEYLLKVVWGTLSGLLTPLMIGSGHGQALMQLLVLLVVGAVGGAFAGLLVLLHLAFKAVGNGPNCLLARGISGGDVEELLSGSWALMS